jgi:uncharacterized protein (UPF0333 family)
MKNQVKIFLFALLGAAIVAGIIVGAYYLIKDVAQKPAITPIAPDDTVTTSVHKYQ